MPSSTRRRDSTSASPSSTSSSCTSTPPSPPSTHCARCPAKLGRRRPSQTARLLVSSRELEQGEGVRQRLFDDRNPSYWPRLIVTDADRRDDECPPECSEDPCDEGDADCQGRCSRRRFGRRAAARRRVAYALADRLRFLYVGAARTRRVGRATAPAGADRDAGAPADPRHSLAAGLRPHAVPADGAATTSRTPRASSTGWCWWWTATPPTCRGS